MRLDGAESDRQAIDGAGTHEREDLAGTGDGRQQAAADQEAFRVLGERLPDANRFGGIVLEQHPHAGGAAGGDRVAEGTGHDDVSAEVLAAEERGVTLEAAVVGDALHVECGELGFVRLDGSEAEWPRLDHDERSGWVITSRPSIGL
jgi:hypothetical protein